MIFPGNNNNPSLVQPVSPAANCQLDAAVLVCDTFLTFDSDTAVHQWAAKILERACPEYQLARMAKVEAIVGHKGSKKVMYTNMQDLLHLMLTRMELPPHEYDIEFFEVEVKSPPMWIWCIVAVRLN
jgi:hypothetical protein